MSEMDTRLKNEIIPAPGVSFEQGFMSHSLEKQVAHCDHYELANYFKKWLPLHQPILEAGCGSGRWVAWFVRNGWISTGLDWSEACCERARQVIPEAKFVAGDMRNMPFDNEVFGAIVSLGAIEHSPEGPASSLKEYYRVLQQGGIGIITVPYLSPIRKIHRLLTSPLKALSRNSFLRQILGKRVGSGEGKTIDEVRSESLSGFAADYILSINGWEFYQYHLSKPQMQIFLMEAGFEIIEEFIDFGDEGILHNFGRVVGKYDYDNGKVSFSVIGKMLRKILPVYLMGHMLCYLVRKNNMPEGTF